LCFRAINIKTVNEQYSYEEDQLWDSLFDEVRHLNKVGTGGGNGVFVNSHVFHWAWLAGLIDGDGSIFAARFGRCQKIVCKLSLTNHYVIDYIGDKVGRQTRCDKVRGNRRVTKSIRFLSNDLINLLPKVIPFLVLKRSLAQLAYRIISLRMVASNRVNPEVVRLISRMCFLNRNKQRDALFEIASLCNGVPDYVNYTICFGKLVVRYFVFGSEVDCDCDMLIYEDEWLRRRGCFERLLLNRVGVNFPSVKLRPRECVVKLVECGEARNFYERFHYQGYVHSSFNVGVLFNDKLVACMSIKRPSRQLSGDWEVSRMACDFNVRVHGLWSFLIKWVKREKLISGRLVSFSDNRLMTGGVYERMGFVRVGDVKPDYYWVKGNKRFHKSGLRKTKEEKKSGLTEIQLRSSQGYSRIYDLGKVKWELVI
jgi:hypothetical protein